ncbi:putative uncharacterized protein DDB_G0285869 [Nematostella vectensis]|uniref:putative uncharacterized protein DDB_G0285869 n=1 Tax=Nematostella vectensis TaxID=45351 RepID=UPI0020772E3F|nr:putative uncharacterized protein DDB_G0285869 [Nematostella vectensis]
MSELEGKCEGKASAGHKDLAKSTEVQQERLGSGFYPWKEEIARGSVDKKAVDRILERRTTEIRECYEIIDNQKMKKSLEEEWIALVIEKDKSLRRKIEEENEQLKREYLQQLHKTLEALRTFDFNNPRDAIFKRNLVKMHKQVGNYCLRVYGEMNATKLPMEMVVRDETREIAVVAPMPPPPPPPPPRFVPFTTGPDSQQASLRWKNSECMEPHSFQELIKGKTLSKTSDKRDALSTPTQTINQELLQRIRKGCLSELKSTPCKRSPGGTPVKRQRRLSESDTSDLITIALKRKFQNAIMYSPNENKSPNIRSPSSEFP